MTRPRLSPATAHALTMDSSINFPRSSDAPRGLQSAEVKRMLDVIVAAAALIVLAPLMIVVAVLIKLTDGGPVIYASTRIGRFGVPFSFYKFRSMRVDAAKQRAELMEDSMHGAAGITFKIARDPRVTWIGRLIRKGSIDELPQLWNVLLGDMSLVGPRPPIMEEVEQYEPHHYRRFSVLPGITCLWQVMGRAQIPFEQQVQLDVEYINTRTLGLDLKLMALTIPAVLTARGAY